MSADNRDQRDETGKAADGKVRSPPRTAKMSRTERLAAELRGNLRKRKALARTRGEPSPGDSQGDKQNE